MMQQIATSKSNLAALGVSVDKEHTIDPSRAESFRELMRNKEKERGFAEPVDPVPVAPSKKPEQPTVDDSKADVEPSDRIDVDNVRDEREEVQATDGESQNTSDTGSENKEQSVKGSDETATELNTEVVEEDVVESESDTKVDWLGLLEKANERYATLENSEPVEDATLIDKVELEIQVNDEQSASGEATQEQESPLKSILIQVAQDSETSDELKAQLELIMSKLDGENLSDEETQVIELALEQWLAGQQDEGVEVKQSDVNVAMLLSLLDTDRTSQGEELKLEQLLVQGVEEGTNKIAQKPVDTDLKLLLEMPERKLDSVLVKLAEQLNLQKVDAEKQRQLSGSEQLLDSAVKNVETTDSKANADFIASMKAGLEEMKSQIKQGHQPAIDLKALVNESMQKVVSIDQVASVSTEKVDQAVSMLSKTLEFAQLLNASADNQNLQAVGYERLANRETAQQVGAADQARQQLQSGNDKAINITRPDGHIQMADKVRWMVNSNNLQADIRLDPPELGSMQIRVNVSGEAASVSFVVQSQQARDVLEQATPRLKELLEEQGIQLGQSSVQQESDGDKDADGAELTGNKGRDGTEEEDTQPTVEQRVVNGRLSGIDYYV